jgi:hypothetical protein
MWARPDIRTLNRAGEELGLVGELDVHARTRSHMRTLALRLLLWSQAGRHLSEALPFQPALPTQVKRRTDSMDKRASGNVAGRANSE